MRRRPAQRPGDGSLRDSARIGHHVTFNQWGREFPMDGMNDAGLVIALMWLDETVYPRDERPSLSVLEWNQYGLDNRRLRPRLLANIERKRIAGGTPLHDLIADAAGACPRERLPGACWLNGRRRTNGPSDQCTLDRYEL